MCPMFLKERSESEELLALRYLNKRLDLTTKEKFHYSNLEKGYEGELKFDLLAKDLKEERFILNDLLLEVNNSQFQIDSILISQGVIHLLDIKNYEGDCYLESDKLYSVTTGYEYKNPVNQLQRCATLFRQFLQTHKLNFLVEAYVIFINPEFTLYQAPKDQPIIFPTQVNRFLRDLNKTPSTLNDGYKKLAQTLLSAHQTKNRFTTLPGYTYDQLQKGVYCKSCGSLQFAIKYADFVCKNCGEPERIEQAITRNVKEFKLLFPNERITTKGIYEWCNTELCERTFRRVLKKNFAQLGNNRHTYYE